MKSAMKSAKVIVPNAANAMASVEIFRFLFLDDLELLLVLLLDLLVLLL
jgi:hypothetical protein